LVVLQLVGGFAPGDAERSAARRDEDTMRQRAFFLGFIGGLVGFAAANFWSFRTINDAPVIIDAPRFAGVPLVFYSTGGFGGDAVLWANLGANFALAVAASALLGSVCAALTRRQMPQVP
jgi:hypothetical protein